MGIFFYKSGSKEESFFYKMGSKFFFYKIGSKICGVFFMGMNIPRKVILYTPADKVTFVFNFSSLSPQKCCYKCFNVVKSSVSFPFVLRQIYAKWKLFSKYRSLYIYLFMFPILRLHPLLHCAFNSFLCLRIFFVSVPGSLLVGRNTLLFTAPPLPLSVL